MSAARRKGAEYIFEVSILEGGNAIWNFTPSRKQVADDIRACLADRGYRPPYCTVILVGVENERS